MRPRSIESVNEFKKLSLALQAFDHELEQKLQQSNQEYLHKYKEITQLLETYPDNIVLTTHRKDELSKNYQRSIEEIAAKRENKYKDKSLYEKIYAILINQNDEIKYAAFKKDFSKALTDLDDKISQTAKLVNEDIQLNALEETKKIDDYIFTIVNGLAAKDIMVNIDQLTITLIMELAFFTDNDLEKSNTLANEIISHMTEFYMANKKISYEMLAKKIEETLDPRLEKKFFVPLLHAIRKPCLEYIRHKEFMYNDLYNTKKIEFHACLSEHNKELIKQHQETQKQARVHAKENMLSHLLKSKNPKDFHLSIVKLGIEEVEAKRRSNEHKNEQYLLTFKQHQLEVLKQLSTEINTILFKYSSENEMTYPAIKTLIPEVQQMYMQIAVAEYVPQSNSTPTKDLKTFEDKEQKTHSITTTDKSDHTESIHSNKKPAIQFYDPEKIKQKSLLRFNSYNELMKNDNIRQFKLVMHFEKNFDILIQLKKETELDPSKKNYLDIIDEQLKYYNVYQRSFMKSMSTSSKVSLSETTPVISSMKLVK